MRLPLKGRSLYYDFVGSPADPVACLTHSLAADGGMWAEQLPALIGAGFRVLRLDMRGHGGSDALPGGYTMEELADDVATVIDALGIDQVHYVGLSIGGMIGQVFAFKYGARVRSLMLCDTRSAPKKDDAGQWSQRIAVVREANSLLPVADATMARWLTDRYKAANPVRWKQIRDTVVGTTPQGFCGCAEAIQNFNFSSRLSSITVPALIVCGSDDPGAPPEENRQIAKLLPNARYEEIAGARHFPNVELPEVFTPLMMNWLESFRS